MFYGITSTKKLVLLKSGQTPTTWHVIMHKKPTFYCPEFVFRANGCGVTKSTVLCILLYLWLHVAGGEGGRYQKLVIASLPFTL